MTKINVLLASLNKNSLSIAKDRILTATEPKGVEVNVVDHPVTSIRDVRNSVEGDPLEDPTAVWLLDLLEETRWDFHGEACRRIIERDDMEPKLHGAYVQLTLRYHSELTEAVTNVEYPSDVVAQLQTEDAPPAVIHSAPFSYDPYHEYYTEVENYEPFV